MVEKELASVGGTISFAKSSLFHFSKFEGPREVIVESLFSAFTFY